MKRNRKKLSLVERLRAPIDETHNVIDPFNSISNLGLRLLANKLDAIGEAMVYVVATGKATTHVVGRNKIVKLKGKLTGNETAQLDSMLSCVGALPIIQHLADVTSKADLLDAVKNLEDDDI